MLCPEAMPECCEVTLHTTRRGGEDPQPEPSTHRLRAVPAAVPRLVLSQPLFLFVQRPRLQDHLFQLEGGVTVQAAFLCRDRVLSPAYRCHPTPPAWACQSQHTDFLHWAQSPAPPSSRSGHPRAHGPVMVLSACLGDWKIGAQGSR